MFSISRFSRLGALTSFCALMAALQADAFTPCAPTGLNVNSVNGIVDLSWEWGNAGNPTATFGFESDTLPEGCSVKATNPDPELTWTIYDFNGSDETFAHDGTRVVMLPMGFDDKADSTLNHQDEWLILNPGEGAVYMDFWYFLHPQLLEDGGFRDFPDHYYVHISRDKGATWTELWDGRWDIGRVEGLQQASIFLGEPTDADTRIAFNAVSADNLSLFYLWIVDDVQFLSAEEKAATPLRIKARDLADLTGMSTGSIATHRTFTPSTSAQARRAPRAEWLNNGLTTFRIYAGDILVGDYIKARNFTDYTRKDAGRWEYRVMAWNEAEDREYPFASTEVDIVNPEFPMPRNPIAYVENLGSDRYTVSVSWEAPEGNLKPSHYNVYLNDKSIGWIDDPNDLSLGQTGLYKGLYEFAIEAVYDYPEGTSGRVYASAAAGTVYTAENLRLSRSGADNILTWSHPSPAGTVPAYDIYRGDLKVASGLKDTSFTDANAPEGVYTYHVHAVYEDGEISLPATVKAGTGTAVTYVLPFRETFDNGHLPSDWEVSLVDPRMSIKDMYAWRFDNWFDIKLPSPEGFDGGFASVSGIAAGMNKLETHVTTPPVVIPAEGATLSFNCFYADDKMGPTGSAQFLLMASPDNGTNWYELKDLAASDEGVVTTDLADYAGTTSMIRWSFLSRNSGEAAIDNVQITAGSTAIVTVETDNSDRVSIHTPSGVTVARNVTRDRISTLTPGIYLISSGGKTTKIMVR